MENKEYFIVMRFGDSDPELVKFITPSNVTEYDVENAIEETHTYLREKEIQEGGSGYHNMYDVLTHIKNKYSWEYKILLCEEVRLQ